jgi:hypothetical protein
MIFSAISWNIANLGPTLKLRRRIQKKRVKNDKEIFEKVLVKVNWKEMFSHFKKVEKNF